MKPVRTMFSARLEAFAENFHRFFSTSSGVLHSTKQTRIEHAIDRRSDWWASVSASMTLIQKTRRYVSRSSGQRAPLGLSFSLNVATWMTSSNCVPPEQDRAGPKVLVLMSWLSGFQLLVPGLAFFFKIPVGLLDVADGGHRGYQPRMNSTQGVNVRSLHDTLVAFGVLHRGAAVIQ